MLVVLGEQQALLGAAFSAAGQAGTFSAGVMEKVGEDISPLSCPKRGCGENLPQVLLGAADCYAVPPYACAFWRDARSARKSSRAMTPGDGGGGGGGELGARCMDRALRSSCARASAESLQALGIQTTIAAKG